MGVRKSVSPDVENLLREISGPYAMAQLFTMLWTASFRPRYEQGRRCYRYVSALALAGIAVSLSICHKSYANGGTKNSITLSLIEYILYGLPLSLHFGWTTAASLVNLNGMFAMKTKDAALRKDKQEQIDEESNAKSVAILGHASVVLATMIGVSVTWIRKAPVYG